MATGSGKTTVMGMLAAWSILNKVNDRNDSRFSDVVPVVAQARSISMIEQVAGLMYVAFVISRLVGLTLLRDRRAA